MAGERLPSPGTRQEGHHVKNARSRARVDGLVIRLPWYSATLHPACIGPGSTSQMSQSKRSVISAPMKS
jgi:hypothetical protein